MAQIQSGRLRMKPRHYYTLLAFVSTATVVLASLVSGYVFSIFLYWVRIHTASTPAWGARARLSEALASFPWWALVVSLLLMILAVWLMRRHGRMYRHRTTALVLAMGAVTLLLGLGLSYTKIGQPHALLRQNVQQRQMPGNGHGQHWR